MKRATFFISIILIFSNIGLQIIPAEVVFEHGDAVLSVTFSPVDDTLLASGSLDGTVKLWDVIAQTNAATLEGHAAAVGSVAFSPNGMLLASGSYDGTVKLWDVNAHTDLATLDEGAVPITSVAFSPDGTIVASGAADGKVKLWDVETHQNTAAFGGYEAAILEEGGWLTPVSFLTNTTLAYGAMDSIQLWDFAAEENITEFDVPEDLVISVAFSPNGATLAASSVNSVIQLWEVETGRDTGTLHLPSEYFFPLPFFSFSSDGALIAATHDENVGLWDVESGTQINTLFGHTDVVRSVSFSSGGSLASGALDGTVRLWDVSLTYEPQPTQDTLVASTAFPLTEATLPGSVVTLTLTGHLFVDDEWVIADAISVSGVDGVTVSAGYFDSFGVERVSDTKVTVLLEFDGTDFDTDATLAFSVGADAIVDSNDQGFTALIPVAAVQKSNATVSISPASVVSPAVGEELTFSLNIESGENVAGYQVAVLFDPTALNFLSRTDGDYGDYLPVETFFADNGWIFAAKTFAGARNGDGTLATLTFEVVDFKPSVVTLPKAYLVDEDGNRWETATENAEVTISPEPAEAILGDINRDGVVNIQDLAIVGARLGQRGQNSADLNGDQLVDIVDLVLVASAFSEEAAAPSLYPHSLEPLTSAKVRLWLKQAQSLSLSNAKFQKGIRFLNQLLTVLIPKETVLLPNYPNPFNPETWIPYHLSNDADVQISIHDSKGVLLRWLDLGHQAAGYYTERTKAAYWDGRNEFGEQVASGLYFYQLRAGEYTALRRMVIVK